MGMVFHPKAAVEAVDRVPSWLAEALPWGPVEVQWVQAVAQSAPE